MTSATRPPDTSSSRPVRPRDIIDTATRRRLAALIPCDERSIDKVLRGRQVRGDVGTRIRAALTELGVRP